MNVPYDSSYSPPFPALAISLVNAEEGLRVQVPRALVDTGSDGTLVPLALLRQILTPAFSNARIASHWGEWRSAQLFEVDFDLGTFRLPSVVVVGDELGDEVVLGRNVLNKLRLLLDGPAGVSEIR